MQIQKMIYTKRKKDVKNAERISAVYQKALETEPTPWKAVEFTAKKCNWTVNGVWKLLKREGLYGK